MPRRLLSPWVVAAVAAAVYLLVAPPSADLAAQEYRAELGLTLWDNGWYAGHHTPGYSLLFPPLGGLLGAGLTGALAAVAAAALFAPLAVGHWGPRAGGAAALWFAAAAAAMLLTGRLTFLLGVAIGAGALLALARDRRLLAAVLAAATTLASPVAGLFVALAVAAWALAGPAHDRVRTWAWGAAIGAAALAPVAATLVLFPEGGTHPLPPLSFWPALAAVLALAALLPAQERALRIGALLYALLLVAAFVVDSPLGGNSTRLGALAAGPVLLGALLGRRSPLLLALLALPLAVWALRAPVRDVVRATGDPSVQAAYYAPLLDFLQARRGAGSFRVEIPMTANHGEARHVAGGPARVRARARLGAPARPPLRVALLRRPPRRHRLPRLAGPPRGGLRRRARRRARPRRPRRGPPRPSRPAVPARGLARRALARLRRAPPRPAGRRARGSRRLRDPEPRRLDRPRRASRRRARARALHAVVARHGRARLRERGAGRDDAGHLRRGGHDLPARAAVGRHLPGPRRPARRRSRSRVRQCPSGPPPSSVT